MSRAIKQAFIEFPNWKSSGHSLRELRRKVTFAIFVESGDPDQVAALVDQAFNLLKKADRVEPNEIIQ